jgi:hypothetical protein
MTQANLIPMVVDEDGRGERAMFYWGWQKLRIS